METDKNSLNSETAQRLAAFRNRLHQLLEIDQRQGDQRFVLKADVDRIGHQVAGLLEKRSLETPATAAPLFLLVGGESASGKTTISNLWLDQLSRPGDGWAGRISLDNYYHDNSLERAKYPGLEGFYRNFDLDSPGAVNLDLAAQQLKCLGLGQAVLAPRHNIATGVSEFEAVLVQPTPVIIVEGLFATSGRLTDQLGAIPRLQVFVDAEADTIQRRWFARIETMAKSVGWVVPKAEWPEYFGRVRAAAETHILPNKATADLVINGEAPDHVTSAGIHDLSELLVGTLQA